MTQQQIARHLGTTREVIARILALFVKSGSVRTRRGSVVIIDRGTLRQGERVSVHAYRALPAEPVAVVRGTSGGGRRDDGRGPG